MRAKIQFNRGFFYTLSKNLTHHLTLLIFFTIGLFHQVAAQTDFRNVKWGMSMTEVENLETSPLTKKEKSWSGNRGNSTYFDGNDLTYEGTTVAGKKADLYYHFDNGRLTKIRVVFRHDLYTNYKESMTNIVLGFGGLMKALGERGFKYTSAIQCGNDEIADYSNPLNLRIRSMNSLQVDAEKLSLIERMISEKHYKAAFFRMENLRTQGSVMFATQYSEFKDSSPIIMKLQPNSKIQSEINKSDL